jgi:hypothetical protein
MKNAVLRMLFAVMILVAFGGAPLSINNGAALASDKNERDISEFLKNFVGKAPEGDYVVGRGFKPHTALWDNPNIKKSLLKTIGVKRTNLLITGWGADRITTTNLCRFDDIVYFFSSKVGPKGNGNKNLLPMALVYIKMTDGSVQACYADDSGDFWIDSEGKARKLPIGYCNIDVTDNLAKKIYYENNPQTTFSSKSAVSAASESVPRPSASAKSDTSSCQGVSKYKGEDVKNKAALEVAITKQLKNSGGPEINSNAYKLKVTLLYVYAKDNWTILMVRLCENCDVYLHLFYSGNPLTNRYVATSGVGSDWGDDMQKIMDWVLRDVPGIPPKLASCYAWAITH